MKLDVALTYPERMSSRVSASPFRWLCLLIITLVLAGCASDESSRAPSTRPSTAAEGRALVGRLVPANVPDRAGWATDIYAAIAAMEIAPTPENICSVVAITEQESGFRVDPSIPGL